MTVRDVLSEAAALAGLPRPNADSRALGSVRRALYTVFRDAGLKRRAKILAVGTKPITRVKIFYHTPGLIDSFTITGGAYSFEVSGKGGFAVRGSDGERKYEFDTAGECYRGVIAGKGAIDFFGEYAFAVFNLSDYPTPRSNKESDLPDGSGERSYSLTELIGDYLSHADPPTDSCGGIIRKARIVGTRLFLPEDYTGEVYISYLARPEGELLSDDEVLDLPPELSVLVAPLVAAYLLAGEDAELSESCRALYTELLGKIPKDGGIRPVEAYSCQSRWA